MLPGKGLRMDAGYLDKLRLLRSTVAEDGVRAGLQYLNSLTGHRFTALYRFEGDTLRNAEFFDRENPLVTTTEAIPVLASYCVFVRDAGASFYTENARDDDRLGDHPKRPVIQSYCGVPLRDTEGRMFGTICHFDFAATGISRENLELMEEIAPALQRATI
jgi:GAF domain-containing protein